MKQPFSFEGKMAFSHGVCEETDLLTLQKIIPGCQEIRIATKDEELKGIDYVVTLIGQAQINVDAKNREPGCSKYWKYGGKKEPELALETWSIMPHHGFSGKEGWTKSEKSMTDLVFFKFPPQDTTECFLIGFQLLRIAFEKNCGLWCSLFKTDKQKSESINGNTWQSECVFVPVSVVFNAIEDISRQTIVISEKSNRNKDEILQCYNKTLLTPDGRLQRKYLIQLGKEARRLGGNCFNVFKKCYNNPQGQIELYTSLFLHNL